MVNENNSARICALRSRTIRPVREGAYWEKEEIERLEEMFNSGAGITEIALVLERSEPAVVQQIEKLDLYGRKQNPQRKRQNRIRRLKCTSVLIRRRVVRNSGNAERKEGNVQRV